MKKFKKLVLIFTALLLLAGCSSVSGSFTEQMDKTIWQAINAKVPDAEMNNCRKAYYSYYRYNNVGKVTADQIFNKFNINGNTATLALDVESIVNNEIMANNDRKQVMDVATIKNPIYVKEGEYANSSKQLIPYRISVTTIDDNGHYFVYIQTSEFVFVSDVEKGSVQDTVYEMLVLLRTCVIDSKQIILDYGSDSLITTTSSFITLFDDVLPESGYIDELNTWEDDTSFIIIDNSDSQASQEGNSNPSDGEGDIWGDIPGEGEINTNETLE